MEQDCGFFAVGLTLLQEVNWVVTPMSARVKVVGGMVPIVEAKSVAL